LLSIGICSLTTKSRLLVWHSLQAKNLLEKSGYGKHARRQWLYSQPWQYQKEAALIGISFQSPLYS